MLAVKVYHLKPTEHIPNSPYPLLHYPGFFLARESDASVDLGKIYDTLATNGWKTQWIYRYGATQPSHYHSQAHECMAVLSGHATIRFGAADISSESGIQVAAKQGDIFIIPSGVAHKTFDTTPGAELSLLTPGNGHGVEADDPRQAVVSTQLSGFTMIGAYPVGSSWDFQTGLDGQAQSRNKIWGVPRPDLDPVLGDSSAGLRGLWNDGDAR